MKIRSQIIAAAATVTLATFLAGLAGLWSTHAVGDRFGHIIWRTAPSLAALQDMKTAALKERLEVLSFALEDSKGGEGFRAAKLGVDGAYAEYAKLVESENEVFLGALGKTAGVMHAAGLEHINCVKRGEKDCSADPGKKAREEFLALADKAIAVEAGELTREKIAADKIGRFAWKVILGAVVLSVLFSTVAGFLIFRSVAGPITALARAISGLRGGDFSRRVPALGENEFGELAASFNEMAASLERSSKEMAQARDYAGQLLENMIDPVLALDPDGTIKTVNLAAEELLCRSGEKLTGRRAAAIFEGEDLFGAGWEKLLKEGRIRDYRTACKAADGEKIPVNFSASVVRGKETILIGTVHDMRESLEVQRRERDLAAAAAAAEADKRKALQLQALNQQLLAGAQQLRASNQQLLAKEQALLNSQEKLNSKMNDLERFNRLVVGRELDMLKLKEEVNSLLEKAGLPKKYGAPGKIGGQG